MKGYLGEVCTCILCRGDGRGLSRVEEGGGSVAEGVGLSVHLMPYLDCLLYASVCIHVCVLCMCIHTGMYVLWVSLFIAEKFRVSVLLQDV